MSQIEVSNDIYFSERMNRREANFSFKNRRLSEMKMRQCDKKFYKELSKQIKFNENIQKVIEKLNKRDIEVEMERQMVDNNKKANARVVLVKY